MGTGVISRIKSFIAQPFTQQMDLTNWILFLIVIITIAFLWTRVLQHIEPV